MASKPKVKNPKPRVKNPKPRPKAKVSFGRANKSYAGARAAVMKQSPAEAAKHNAIWAKNKMFLTYKKTHPKVMVQQFRIMFLVAARNAALASKKGAASRGDALGARTFTAWKANLHPRDWTGKWTRK